MFDHVFPSFHLEDKVRLLGGIDREVIKPPVNKVILEGKREGGGLLIYLQCDYY